MIVRTGVGQVDVGQVDTEAVAKYFPYLLGGLVLFSLWNALRKRR